MTNRFEGVMSKKSDVALFKIVTGSAEDYQPEGIDAAKKEFERRNLSEDRLEA